MIDAVNQVFQNLTRHPKLDKLGEPVAAWQRAFPPHETTKTELPGFVRVAFAPAATDDEDAGDKLFEFAAERVRQHVREVAAMFDRRARAAPTMPSRR